MLAVGTNRPNPSMNRSTLFLSLIQRNKQMQVYGRAVTSLYIFRDNIFSYINLSVGCFLAVTMRPSPDQRSRLGELAVEVLPVDRSFDLTAQVEHNSFFWEARFSHGKHQTCLHVDLVAVMANRAEVARPRGSGGRRLSDLDEMVRCGRPSHHEDQGLYMRN